jgi:CDP-glycerol glycerophosphotransferase
MAIIPARRQAFVEAFPNDEGNAVEVVRALIDRYDGRIVWANAPDASRCEALNLDPARFTRVAKKSPRGVFAFLRSEVVFNTHGVYGCPKPVRGKAIVNLWHGDGPKGHAGAVVPSTYLVSGSGVFGRRLADAFGVPEEDLLLTGLPRTTQLRHPADASVLRRLGIDSDRRFVVWMPTVRQYSAAGVNAARSDTADPEADVALAELIKPGIRALDALGIQVVVKPHPIDLVSRTFDGFTAVTDADLIAAGTTVYAFLGASSGLLTDYSSVWTDYLALDKPIGFFTPDLEAYLRGRGVHPRSLELLPGRTLERAADFTRYGREVLGEYDGCGQRLRQQARDEFQIVHPPRPADELLDELHRRRALAVEDAGDHAAVQGAR